MNNPYDTAHSLATAIREQQEFKTIKEVQAQVEKEDTSKKMLRDFRQAQMELQMKQMQGQELTEEDQERFSKLVETVKLNPSISKLIEAEQRLNVVLEDVMKIVMEPTKEIYQNDDE